MHATSIDRVQRVLFCGLLLLCSLPAMAGSDGSHWVRLPADQGGCLRAAAVTPRHQVDYGSFIWLEVDEAGLDRLRAGGVSFTEVPQAGTVQVTRYTFDPITDGEPELGRHLRQAEGGPGLRLIQLVGPLKDEWIASLRREGIRILQYYPHNTVLVWTDQPVTRSLSPFVRWQGQFHPGYKICPSLDGRQGMIRNVDVTIFNGSDLRGTLRAIAAAGGEVLRSAPSQPDRAFYDAIVELDAEALQAVAAIPTVLWLGYSSPVPGLDDEMSDQIVAGNHAGGIPVTGYADHLAALGYDGSSVVWATIDTGVDYDHPDLGPNIVGGYSYPGACYPPDQPGSDCGGHGTHVAGIISGTGVGDAGGPYTDGDGFRYGLGVAPGGGIFATNSLVGSSWPPEGGWQEHSKQAVLGGAVGGNNSWHADLGTQHGYQAEERTHDIMVRDGNFDTADVAEPFIEVFSAGNSGGYGLTAPKEAKNLIVVASTHNYRTDGDIDAVSSFSSRGPAVDGRWVPTVAAPGSTIASTANDGGGSCSTAIDDTNGLYAYCSGTSMAAPHVSGALVLITEWWRTLSGGVDPSPAMAKALLVNGAVDMGTPDVPNIHEGWGRINVTHVIQPEAPVVYHDQETVFTDTGQVWSIDVAVAEPGHPLKVSLAWTDAPGAVGADPALVNDLDLEVLTGGTTYFGNQFTDGWSAAGGTPDTINNLENVFVAAPGDMATITVRASHIAGDGVPLTGDTTDQDMALVCFNCVVTPIFTIGVEPESRTACAPDDVLFDVEVGSLLGFADPVSLAAAGNPAGTTVSFDPAVVSPPGISTMTIGTTAGGDWGLFNVEITGTAGTISKSQVVAVDLSTAVPGAPSLVSPVDASTTIGLFPTFSWNPVTQALAYEIEIARDAGFAQVEERAVVPSTHYEMPGILDERTQYFWRVRSSNHCGNGSFSEPFQFTTPTLPSILLVDDDTDDPDVRAYYSDALQALGFAHDIWDVATEGAEPDGLTLGSYQTVIWFTGNRTGGTAGPGAAAEADLSSFLENGGRMALCSQDYLYDRGRTPFGADYLGIATYLNDTGHDAMTGEGLFAGLGPYGLSDRFRDYGDTVVPAAGADVAFTSELGTAAISKKTAQYQTFFLAFPFEAIDAAADRVDVMGRLLGDPIFRDGFESGDIGMWSAHVP